MLMICVNVKFVHGEIVQMHTIRESNYTKIQQLR